MQRSFLPSGLLLAALLPLVSGTATAQRRGSLQTELASVTVPCASTATTGIAVHSAGTHVRMRNRSTFVVKTLGTASTDYYNLPTAYYQFLFQYTSNPSEGAIANGCSCLSSRHLG